MPQYTTGDLLVIDRRTDPYDFADRETGEQVKGETHVLVVHDQNAHRAYDVKVKRSAVPNFEHVKPGDWVRLVVEVFARGNRTQETAVALAV